MKKILVLALAMALVLVGGVMAGTTGTATASVTVNSFLSITADKSTITFSDMDPGTGPTAATDNPITATVGAETNVDVNISTSADAATFSGATASFAVDNMEWSDASAGTYTGYTTSDAQVCGDLGASDPCSLYHRISIPNAQKAETYSVGITIKAITA